MSQEAQIAVEAASGIGTLGINLKIFIAQLINFSIVLLVLWRFAYKPIVKLLEERQKKIENGVAQAEEAQKKLIEIEKERENVLKETREEAMQLVESTRAQVEEKRKLMLEKAKDEVGIVVAHGKEQLKNQKEQMMREAREEIAQIAVEAARKILSESVDEKKAMKLAQEAVDNFKV
jgi:F-type H+-transporting ATPase subunit b